jgi:hypothetical protein
VDRIHISDYPTILPLPIFTPIGGPQNGTGLSHRPTVLLIREMAVAEIVGKTDALALPTIAAIIGVYGGAPGAYSPARLRIIEINIYDRAFRLRLSGFAS